MLRCSDCGERSPDNATFCILCGARLSQRATLTVTEPYKATGPTIRLRTADTARSSATQATPAAAPPAAHISMFQVLCPLLGLLFTIVIVAGIDEVLAVLGLADGVWAAVVLAGGALVAQRAWINGNAWGGLRGMLLWGGLTWLIAAGEVVPWALALLLGWALMHPRLYGRHGKLKAES